MSPRWTKFSLTAHITASVGWMGAVVAFVALALAGLRSDDPQVVRGAYLAMDVTAWYVILPLCLASLLTGLVHSLGTTWGLFRHYWVLFKLVINVLSTLILLIHMQPISFLADMAAQMEFAPDDHAQERLQMVLASGLAVVALVVATVLSVYKPRGLTPYGWRKQKERLASQP